MGIAEQSSPITLPTAAALPPKTTSPTPVPCPFTILVDDREVTSGGVFPFRNLTSSIYIRQRESVKGNKGGVYTGSQRPVEVKTEVGRMLTGDYSIVGLGGMVAIERKAISDLYGSLGSGRENFEKEHVRMADMIECARADGKPAYAAVVIEGDWAMVAEGRPQQSKIFFASIYGTANHWAMRYGVPWWAESGRRAAELRTFRLLEAFWVQWMKGEEERGRVEAEKAESRLFPPRTEWDDL